MEAIDVSYSQRRSTGKICVGSLLLLFAGCILVIVSKVVEDGVSDQNSVKEPPALVSKALTRTYAYAGPPYHYAHGPSVMVNGAWAAPIESRTKSATPQHIQLESQNYKTMRQRQHLLPGQRQPMRLQLPKDYYEPPWIRESPQDAQYRRQQIMHFNPPLRRPNTPPQRPAPHKMQPPKRPAPPHQRQPQHAQPQHAQRHPPPTTPTKASNTYTDVQFIALEISTRVHHEEEEGEQ